MKHKHKPDKNSARIQAWIRNNPGRNRTRLRKLLEEHGAPEQGITQILRSQSHGALRRKLIAAIKRK